MNLEKYSPINSYSTVDQIITDLLNLKPPIDDINKVEIQILFDIKKVKVQLYFKEQFKNVRNELILSNTQNKIVNLKAKKIETTQLTDDIGRKRKPVKINQILTFEMLIGKDLEEVATIINQKTSILISLIHKRKTDLTDLNSHSSFNELHWDLSSDFLINSYYLKLRKEKETQSDGIISIQRRNSKFKPTYGKEGNYSKLIYIRTKT